MTENDWMFYSDILPYKRKQKAFCWIGTARFLTMTASSLFHMRVKPVFVYNLKYVSVF